MSWTIFVIHLLAVTGTFLAFTLIGTLAVYFRTKY